MNTYRLRFKATCPVNQQVIDYRLTIRSREMIRVEKLQAKLRSWTKYPVFHESIADDLAIEFPGRQVLRAHHHGVDIKTVRNA